MMNIKKYVSTLFLSGMIFSCCCGAEQTLPLLAQWDFTKGKLTSEDGKYALNLRGNTALGKVKNKTMLRIGMSRKAEGAQFGKLNPELVPQGALRYEFTLRMREPDSPNNMLVLFDSKYSFYNPSNHTGFALLLSRSPKNRTQYRMMVFAGLASGKSTPFYCPKFITLSENKEYTLAYEYDGKATFSFYLDGRKVGAQTRKGAGVLAPPKSYRGVIGDRHGSSYNHFQGDILSVRIYGKKQ